MTYLPSFILSGKPGLVHIVRGLVHLLAGGITYKPTEGRVIFKVSFAC
jgi:hypothetical protein